jgi:hypothetical protein
MLYLAFKFQLEWKSAGLGAPNVWCLCRLSTRTDQRATYFFCQKYRKPWARAANESSRAELGLTQARLMKIRVELSRARETVRAEKPSSNTARYYSS